MEESTDPQEIKTIIIDNVKYKTRLTKKYMSRKAYATGNPGNIYSFIPGTILNITAREGEKVKKGDQLLVLEAMKMANNLIAPVDGVVKRIHVKTGDQVPKNFLLVEIE